MSGNRGWFRRAIRRASSEKHRDSEIANKVVDCQPSSVRGAHLAGPSAAIPSRIRIAPPQTFAPARSRDFISALIAISPHARDSTAGENFAYVYFEDEPGRRSAAKLLSKDEARRIAVNIVKLPDLGDRFLFQARSQYDNQGPWKVL